MKQYSDNIGPVSEDKGSFDIAPLELEGGEAPSINEEKVEKKTEDVEKEEKEDEGDGQVAWKAYLGAAGAAVGLGLADYLASLLAKLALKGVWAEWFGCLVAWLTYHIYCYIEWQCKKESPDAEYMTKASSMYYEVVPADEADPSAVAPSDQEKETGKDDAKKQYRFSRIKTIGMITRFIFQLGIQLSLLTTFYFGSRSGVNNGIISTIFSSGVIFTAIIFFFVYGQKVSCYDVVGALGIIGCVVLISAGGAGGSHGEEKKESGGGHGPDLSKGLSAEDKNFNLMLAIISATVTGLVFALNSLSIQFCTSIGCGVSQANMDAMMVMFLVLLPGFLVIELGREAGEPSPYGWEEMIIATAILVTQVFGIISLSIGLKYGTAGPVQAIENQKTTIQTLLEAIVQSNMPLPIQWGGLACGVVGVTVIVCQPKKEAPAAEKKDDNKIEPSEGNEENLDEKARANEVK